MLGNFLFSQVAKLFDFQLELIMLVSENNKTIKIKVNLHHIQILQMNQNLIYF